MPDMLTKNKSKIISKVVAIYYNIKNYNPAKDAKMVILLGQENWEIENDDFEINLENAEVVAVF